VAGIGVIGSLLAVNAPSSAGASAKAGVGQQVAAFQQVSITKLPSAPCPSAAPCQGAKAAQSTPSSISVLPGGRFEARNQTIENMARVALGFEQIDPVVGVVAESRFSSPHADRFDITAVADREWTTARPGEKVPSEFRGLLRRLLEERFKLQARVELTDVDVFALQLARADRERGPGLRRSTRDCLRPDDDPRAGEGRPTCGFRLAASHMEAGGVTMSELAATINEADDMRMDRFVVDQTGLSGRYDVTVSLNGRGEDRREAVRNALKTQLGLKLVKTRVPLPTLIIEHAEAPAEN
jgi:uncharacterized protein (TIGR03435 family)